MGSINFAAPFQMLRPVDVDPTKYATEYANLGALAQMRQYRQQEMANQQSEMALRQAEVQKQQYGMDEMRAVNKAYMDAFEPDSNGVPQLNRDKFTQALMQAGHGSAIPAIHKDWDEYDKSHAEYQKALTQLAGLQTDHAGAIGSVLKSGGYDPHLALALIQDGANKGTVGGPQAQQTVNEITSRLAQDPSGESAKAWLQPQVEQWIAASPTQQALLKTKQELATGELTQTQKQAEIREKTAAAAKAETEAGQAKFQAGVQMVRSLPRDPQTGLPVQQAWSATQQAYPELKLPDKPDQATIQRLTESTIKPEELPKYQLSQGGFGVTPAEQGLRSAVGIVAQRHGITLDPNQPWQTQLTPKLQGEVAQAARDLTEPSDVKATRALTAELNATRLQDLRDKRESAAGYVQNMLASPDMFQELSPDEKARVGPLWTQATGLPIPTKLPTQLKDQEAGSQIALQRAARIRDALADPAIQSRIGPIAGRLGEAEMTAGATAGLTPEQAQKAQQLRSDMTYLLLGEGKALFGGRMPQNLMKVLEKTSPRTSESLSLLQGALDSVEQNSRDNIATAEKMRFGGQTRPGFQPGFTAPKEPAQQTVAPIKLKDGRTLSPHDAAAAARFRKDHPELIAP
jgi:hypothetical protein